MEKFGFLEVKANKVGGRGKPLERLLPLLLSFSLPHTPHPKKKEKKNESHRKNQVFMQSSSFFARVYVYNECPTPPRLPPW